MLIVELIAKVFAANCPVTVEHVLNTAAADPTPVEFFFAGVDQAAAAIASVALVSDAGFPIHSDATASPVEQKLVPGETKATANGRVKITFAVTDGVVAEQEIIGLMVTTADVHVTK